MRTVGAEQVHALLDYPSLVEALRELYRRGVDAVESFRLKEPLARGQNDWLILPAWQYGRHFGAKLVSVFPGNEAKGLASILGLYLLFDGDSGRPLLCIDGAALTLRKTAANSALAATYLAHADAARLLLVGAGELGPHLALAHAAVRPVRRIEVWNRTPRRAEAAVERLRAEPTLKGVAVALAQDIEAAVREADIVTCATMATAPLVRGAWLRPGMHLDLVGGFRPDMREADDEAVRRSRVFIDARFTAAAHCGDISEPLRTGVIRDVDIADLFELARGTKPGRRTADEITTAGRPSGPIVSMAPPPMTGPMPLPAA
jgi:ornithine cyclodeaminase